MNQQQPQSTADTIAIIRDIKPAKLRLHFASGDPLELEVPKQRKRWAALADELRKHVWSRMELLNEKGVAKATLEPEEHDEDDPIDRIRTESREGELLKLVLQGQRYVLDRFESAFANVMNRQAEMLDRTLGHNVALEQARITDMETIRELYMQAQSQGNDMSPESLASLVVLHKLGMIDKGEFASKMGLGKQAPAVGDGKGNGPGAPAAAGKE